jgi:hypothetical protein
LGWTQEVSEEGGGFGVVVADVHVDASVRDGLGLALAFREDLAADSGVGAVCTYD